MEADLAMIVRVPFPVLRQVDMFYSDTLQATLNRQSLPVHIVSNILRAELYSFSGNNSYQSGSLKHRRQC